MSIDHRLRREQTVGSEGRDGVGDRLLSENLLTDGLALTNVSALTLSINFGF